MPSLSLLLLGSFICFGAGCGACPTSADSLLGILPVFIVFSFICDRFYKLFCFLFILFMILFRVPA